MLIVGVGFYFCETFNKDNAIHCTKKYLKWISEMLNVFSVKLFIWILSYMQLLKNKSLF